LVRRELVRRAARELGAAGVLVMPIKGALFAYWIYEDPRARAGSDVDLLVPDDQFERAIGILAARGFAVGPPHANPNERTLVTRQLPLEVDLHRALFSPGRYRLLTRDVFARGSRDETLFGVPVVLPDPLDAYANVIGHAASDHEPVIGTVTRRDLALLAERFRLEPGACAAHLDRCGLGRAARFVLGRLADGDLFAQSLLAHLRPDPVGVALAGLASRLAARRAAENVISRIAGHLVNTSLPRASGAFVLSTVNRLRTALR
jgi:hypothetical protein